MDSLSKMHTDNGGGPLGSAQGNDATGGVQS